MAEELTTFEIFEREKHRKKRSLFLSLRFKLLLLFTLLFAAAIAGAFLWFSDFATNLAFERLRDDLLSVAITTAADIDGDKLVELYQTGPEKGMDNETYLEINERLRYSKWNNPKAFGLYALVANEEDRENSIYFVVSGAVPPVVEPTERDRAFAEKAPEGCLISTGSRPLIGEKWTRAPAGDPLEGFMNSLLNGLNEPNVMDEIYTDKWGEWLSAFAPIRNSAGEIVGVLAVDGCAADIKKIDRDIRESLGIAMAGAFLLLAAIVWLMAYSITRPITTLTHVAALIGQGDYNQDLSRLTGGRFSDEVTKLADVFDIMIDKVAQREETLKKKVASLQIIIDEGKRDKQVEELTENEFFRDIRARAEQMRREKATKQLPPKRSSE